MQNLCMEVPMVQHGEGGYLILGNLKEIMELKRLELDVFYLWSWFPIEQFLKKHCCSFELLSWTTPHFSHSLSTIWDVHQANCVAEASGSHRVASQCISKRLVLHDFWWIQESDVMGCNQVVYEWDTLPIGWLYITYHLLREPETAIEGMEIIVAWLFECWVFLNFCWQFVLASCFFWAFAEKERKQYNELRRSENRDSPKENKNHHWLAVKVDWGALPQVWLMFPNIF